MKLQTSSWKNQRFSDQIFLKRRMEKGKGTATPLSVCSSKSHVAKWNSSKDIISSSNIAENMLEYE